MSKTKVMEENARIRERLEETEEALRAIHAGEVDALVVTRELGEEIYTIQGADHSYRLIFEAMNEGAAVVTQDGLILYCNARWGTLLNQQLEKLIGSNIRPYIPDEGRPGFEKLLAEAGEGIARGEALLKRTDDVLVPVQLALNALNLQGEPTICLVATDLTELKLRDEQLQKNEERLRLLIEDVHGYAIYALNKDGLVESWNSGAERLKGYRAEEILGSHFARFFSPEEIKEGKPYKLLDTARVQGRVEAEGWRLRHDGCTYWAHFVIVALRNGDGELIGFSVVSRDGTQQKRAEEALRLNEELFHSAVDYFPGGFAIYDAQKRFQFVNLVVAKLSGISQSDFVGHTNEELFPPEVTSRYLPSLNRCIQERSGQSLEARFILSNSAFVFSTNFVPILDEHGEIRQVLGIGYDITARREAEQKAEAALKKEQVLRREIQHRVKNSIQIISSLLFLQAREVTDPKMEEVLRECQARARSIALVYGMLSQREEITSIDFSEYARSLLGALAGAYEVQQEIITFPVYAKEILLDLDTAVPCGLILTELVSNALKYAFPGGRKGEVIINLQYEGEGCLLMTCQDNGVGLPAGFNLEEQRSLGLRLVRDLTEQLGGKIQIQSGNGTLQSGNGTLVSIRFPYPRS